MQFSLSLVLLINAVLMVDGAAVQSQNLQFFAGSLGGAPTPVLPSGNDNRPFSVKGDTFVNIAAALQRSCDQQFNACANQANGGACFSVSDCQAQKGE